MVKPSPQQCDRTGDKTMARKAWGSFKLQDNALSQKRLAVANQNGNRSFLLPVYSCDGHWSCPSLTVQASGGITMKDLEDWCWKVTSPAYIAGKTAVFINDGHRRNLSVTVF